MMAQDTTAERRAGLVRGGQRRAWPEVPSPPDDGTGADGGSRRRANAAHAADRAALAALVAGLEQALVAARHLLDTLSGDGDRCVALRRHGEPVRLPLPQADRAACRAGEGLPPALYTPSRGLSRREAEVLRQLAAGRSNGQIAQALYLSPRTVQRHVANAYLKIGAHNKAEATTYALRHGLA